MDTAYFSAFAALAGSVIGGLISLATSWLTQREQFRAQEITQDVTRREELYKNFIEEASRVYVDAYEHDKAEVSKLVNLYALVSRMRVLSSSRIVEHADRVVRLVAHRAGIGDQQVRDYNQERFSRLRVLAHDCVTMLESMGPPLPGETTGMPDGMQLPVELMRFYSARYLHLVEQMIRALAARGRAVIMGRGAQVVLRDTPGSLQVRTVASFPRQVRRVTQQESVDGREAARRIQRRDGVVARYLKHFHRVEWNDPVLYQLTLNTGALCEDDVVQLILRAAPGEEDLNTTSWTG